MYPTSEDNVTVPKTCTLRTATRTCTGRATRFPCRRCASRLSSCRCQHQALVCVQLGLTEIALWGGHDQADALVTRVEVRELFHAHEPMRWTNCPHGALVESGGKRRGGEKAWNLGRSTTGLRWGEAWGGRVGRGARGCFFVFHFQFWHTLASKALGTSWLLPAPQNAHTQRSVFQNSKNFGTKPN